MQVFLVIARFKEEHGFFFTAAFKDYSSFRILSNTEFHYIHVIMLHYVTAGMTMLIKAQQ